MTKHNLAAADLHTGDRLLRLGGVGFAQLRDPDADPVLVADVRPPAEPDEDNPGEEIIEITTSAGTLYTRAAAPALADRDNTVTRSTILLISRRASLHAALTELGTPVIRRAPITDGTVPAVTPAEWGTAPLIVIDGYLAQTTLRDLWARGLPDRSQIVMVGTDPDDTRVYGRQQVARARMLLMLPYDRDDLARLFRTATEQQTNRDPYLGILTPNTAG